MTRARSWSGAGRSAGGRAAASCEPPPREAAPDGQRAHESEVVASFEGAQLKACLRRDLFVLGARPRQRFGVARRYDDEAGVFEFGISGDEFGLAFKHGG